MESANDTGPTYRRILPKLPKSVETVPVCVSCGLKFSLFSLLAIHICDCHPDKILECDICNIPQENKELFLSHMTAHDPPSFLPVFCQLNEVDIQIDQYPCHICGLLVSDLPKHLKIHEPPAIKETVEKASSFLCKICNKSSTRLHDLKRHMKTMHRLDTFENDIDGLLPDHTNNRPNTADRMFPCSICGKKFARSYDVKRHIGSMHSLEKIRVKKKAKAKNTNNVKLLLNSTEGNHDSDQTSMTDCTIKPKRRKSAVQDYSCYVCRKIYLVKDEMLSHRKEHSPEEIAQVQNERVRVMNERKLVSNAKIVLDGRVAYHCEECGQHVFTRYGFVNHLRVHNGYRHFICHACGKPFRTGDQLQRHIRSTHERIKNYSCEYCSRKFANSMTRNDHIRGLHTNERPYVCHTCGKSWKTKASLYIHNKTHSDVLPHCCNHCSKRFRHRQRLKEHLLLHSGERPHTCDVCNKSFRLLSILKNHKLIHTNKGTYKCGICNKFYGQMRYLRNHIRISHKKQASAAM